MRDVLPVHRYPDEVIFQSMLAGGVMVNPYRPFFFRGSFGLMRRALTLDLTGLRFRGKNLLNLS